MFGLLRLPGATPPINRNLLSLSSHPMILLDPFGASQGATTLCAEWIEMALAPNPFHLWLAGCTSAGTTRTEDDQNISNDKTILPLSLFIIIPYYSANTSFQCRILRAIDVPIG